MNNFMKMITFYVILFILIAGIIFYINQDKGLDGKKEFSYSEFKNSTIIFFKNIFNNTKSIFHSISKVKINKTSLLKFSPKSCDVDEPFECDDFLIDKKLDEILITIKPMKPVEFVNISLDGKIFCDTYWEKSKIDDEYFVKFSNCNISENFANFEISYKKKEGELIHISKGLITFGLS